jgi:glycosyltransferase involved in cell wall biosynthesis
MPRPNKVGNIRIIDVNPFFYPYKGGIENRMHQTSTLLAAKGHEVIVLTGRLPDTPEEEVTPEGYRIIRLKSKLLNIYNPPYIRSYGILDTLNSLDGDIVNYNYRWAPSYNKALDAYKGVKIHTVHNTWHEGTGIAKAASAVNDELFWKKMLRFDRIVTVNNGIREDLVARGAPADKVFTIPTCGHVKPYVMRDEGDFILSLGRMVKVKGLKYLIEAMKDVECKLLICGKGPEEKHIRNQIRRLHLEDKVEILGYVSEERKEELMGTCKMLVMPSLYEAFGMVAVEVMAQRRPVIATNVNGLPETVGEGGILVNPADPKALADAINSLLSNDALRLDIGMKARLQAEYYDWSNHIDGYEQFLIDTVEQGQERKG